MSNNNEGINMDNNNEGINMDNNEENGSSLSRDEKLTLDLIREFQDKVDWDLISKWSFWSFNW